MAKSLFDKLEIEAFRQGITPRTKQSRQWFQDRMKDIGNINRTALLKDERLSQRQRFGIGNMYMYFYDPKHRKTLPYYDAFPLTIMVGPAKGGFYGLNMHYLPPPLRAVLFDKLLETTNNDRMNETTKFKINYALLSSVANLKFFRPCFKHYLRQQVDSKIALVEPAEWEVAMFMPTQQFNKANDRKVWAESRKIAKR